MALRVCLDCTTTYAVGLVLCPHCGSERGEEVGADPYRGGTTPMAKITRTGGVTDAQAAVDPDPHAATRVAVPRSDGGPVSIAEPPAGGPDGTPGPADPSEPRSEPLSVPDGTIPRVTAWVRTGDPDAEPQGDMLDGWEDRARAALATELAKGEEDVRRSLVATLERSLDARPMTPDGPHSANTPAG